MEKNKRVYCLKNYPVSEYKKFQLIPQGNLEIISNRLVEKLDRHFHFNSHTSSLNILFAGIGYGRIELPFLKLLRELYPKLDIKVEGIDFSFAMVNELRFNLLHENIKSHLNVIEGDINYTQLYRKYDIIFSLFSFHLFGEKDSTIKLFKTMTNKNALVVLAEEIGDFNFLEKNIYRIRNKEPTTEYSRFWKYYYDELSPNKIPSYCCDLSFIAKYSSIDLIDEFEEYWKLHNINYFDIQSLITGESKVYDFFHYDFDNKKVLNKWLKTNSFPSERIVERKEGHKFYLLKV